MNTSDPFVLPLAGRKVFRIAISRYVPYLRIEFSDLVPDSVRGPDCSLVLEGPLRLESGGETIEIDPKNGPHVAYVGLVEKTVLAATAYPDGSLRVEFTDGDVLSVAPDRYEPWQLEPLDGEGLSVISLAGGGLSISN